MRDNVLLPLDPRKSGDTQDFADVQSGISLPAWHCPFVVHSAGSHPKPCQARAKSDCNVSKLCKTHEKELWGHVQSAHGSILRNIAKKWKLREMSMVDAEVELTLLNSALAEKERRTASHLGHSTDRRAMRHVSEVFTDDSVQVLMCFMCACKELSHAGYDKFGNDMQNG